MAACLCSSYNMEEGMSIALASVLSILWPIWAIVLIGYSLYVLIVYGCMWLGEALSKLKKKIAGK